MLPLSAATLFALAASSLGCSREESGVQPSPQPDLPSFAPGEPIGPAGGRRAQTIGNWKIEILAPPGALEAPVDFTIGEHAEPIAGALGPVFELGPSMQFAKPVRVTISPRWEELPFVTAPRLRVATFIDGAWHELDEATAPQGEIAGTTSHFSLFSLVEDTPSEPQYLADESGTQFTLAGVSLRTSEPVHVRSMQVSEVRVAFVLEAAPPSGSAELTVEGLRAGATLYVYDGSLSNKRVMQTDGQGRMSFTQPLDGVRGIWIQPDGSTVFINADQPGGGDCSRVGTWNEVTRTCKLTGPVSEAIEISTSNTHLDCGDPLAPANAGGWLSPVAAPAHRIAHGGTNGVVIASGVSNVSVRNCVIETYSSTVLVATGATDVRIEGNQHTTTRAIGSLGVNLMSAGSGVIVERNLFLGTARVDIDATAMARVANNTFERRSGPDVFIFGASTGDTTLIDNRFDLRLEAVSRYAIHATFEPARTLISANQVVCADQLNAGFGGGFGPGPNEISSNQTTACRSGADITLDDSMLVTRNRFIDGYAGFRIVPQGESTGEVRVYANDFIGNTFGAYAPAAIELSDPTGQVGNYWGRSCADGPPYFIPGIDTNAADVVDSFAFGHPVAQLDPDTLPPPPDCAVDADEDGDGYIATSAGGDDCNDNNELIHPGALELCDGRDNDCDAEIDEGACAPVIFEPAPPDGPIAATHYRLTQPVQVAPAGLTQSFTVPQTAVRPEMHLVPAQSGRLPPLSVSVNGQQVAKLDQVNPTSRGFILPLTAGQHTVTVAPIAAQGFPQQSLPTLEVSDMHYACNAVPQTTVTATRELSTTMLSFPTTTTSSSTVRVFASKTSTSTSTSFSVTTQPQGQTLVGLNDLNGTRRDVIADANFTGVSAIGVQSSGQSGGSMTIQVVDTDLSSPAGAVTEPLSGASICNATTPVKGYVNKPNVAITVNGVAAQTTTSGTRTDFTGQAVLSPGANTIEVCGQDNCGNRVCLGVNVHRPHGTEVCNGIDDDCDGVVDEGFVRDRDGDGYVSAACGGSDCNDLDPAAWDACTACADNDGDGFYVSCAEYTFAYPGPDCDDANPLYWASCGTDVPDRYPAGPTITFIQPEPGMAATGDVLIEIGLHDPTGVVPSTVVVYFDGTPVTHQLTVTSTSVTGVWQQPQSGLRRIDVSAANTYGGSSASFAAFLVAGADLELEPPPSVPDSTFARDSELGLWKQQFPLEIPPPSTPSGDLLPHAFYYGKQQMGVDPLTHAAVVSTEEFSSRGRGGLDFSLRRLYSSNDAYVKLHRPDVMTIVKRTETMVRDGMVAQRTGAAMLRHYVLQWLQVLDVNVRMYCNIKNTWYEYNGGILFIDCPTEYVAAATQAVTHAIDVGGILGALAHLVHQLESPHPQRYDGYVIGVRGEPACYDLCYTCSDAAKSCLATKEANRPPSYDKTFYEVRKFYFERCGCVPTVMPPPSSPSAMQCEPYYHIEDGYCEDGSIIEWRPHFPTIRLHARLIAEYAHQTLQVLATTIDIHTTMLGEFARERDWQLWASSVGEGWSFNVPFVLLPEAEWDGDPTTSPSTPPGFVFFDGHRPRQFWGTARAVFPEEDAILVELDGWQVPAPPRSDANEYCLGIPFVARNLPPACLRARLPSLFEDGDDFLRSREKPIIEGELFDEAQYRLVQRDRIYYFDALGLLRVVTDPTHNNAIWYHWATDTVTSNRDALQRARLLSIRDAAGNTYDFEYLDVGDFGVLREALLQRRGQTRAYMRWRPLPVLPKSITASYGKRVSYEYELVVPADIVLSGYGDHEHYALKRVRYEDLTDAGARQPTATAAVEYAYNMTRWLACERAHLAETSPYCTSKPGSERTYAGDGVYGLLLTRETGPSGGSYRFVYDDPPEVPEFGRNQGAILYVWSRRDDYEGVDVGYLEGGKYLYRYRAKSPEVIQFHRKAEGQEVLVSSHWSTLPSRGETPAQVMLMDTFEAKESSPWSNGYQLELQNQTWPYALQKWVLTRRWVESGTVPQTVTEFDHDDFGNIEVSQTWMGAPGIQVTRTYVYPPNGMGLLVYGTPVLEDVAVAGELLRQVHYEYHADYPWLVTRVDGDTKPMTLVYETLDESERGSNPARALRPTQVKVGAGGGQLIHEYSYDRYGNLIGQWEAGAPLVRLTYHAANELVEVYPEARTRGDGAMVARETFAHDSRGLLVQHRDARGYTRDWTYDGFGRILTYADAGTERGYTYGRNGVSPMPRGRNTANTAVAGVDVRRTTGARHTFVDMRVGRESTRVLELTGDGLGRVAMRTDRRAPLRRGEPAPSTTEFYTYDEQSRLIRLEVADEDSPRGLKSGWKYDALGRVSQTVNAFGGVTNVESDDALVMRELDLGPGEPLRRTIIADPVGAVQERFHDGLGRLRAVRMTADLDLDAQRVELLWRYGYDSRNRVIWTRNADGTVVHIRYDELDRITRRVKYRLRDDAAVGDFPECEVDDPECLAEEWAYEPGTGRLTSVTAPNGGRQRAEYDAMGRVARVYDANNEATVYAYDDNNNVIEVAKPGRAVGMAYDHRNRMRHYTDPDKHQFTYQYDAFDDLVSVSHDATGHQRRMWYDAQHRVIQTIDEEDGRSVIRFDAVTGLPQWSEGPRGEISAYTYQLEDPTGGSRALTVCDSKSVCTRTRLDALGRPTSVGPVDGVPDVIVRYNALGRIESLLPNGDWRPPTAWRYGYDRGGRLARKLSPQGRVEERTYDLAGRLKDVRYRRSPTRPVEEEWNYEYDKLGHLVKVANPLGGELIYERDLTGRVDTLIRSGLEPLAFSYSTDGRSVVATEGGLMQTTYLLDGHGRVVEARDAGGYTTRRSFDYRGLLKEESFGRQGGKKLAEEVRTYYPTGRLHTVTRSDGGMAQFQYDPAGNVTAITEPSGHVWSMAYDEPIDRPTKISSAAYGVVDVVYDRLGRVRTETRNADVEKARTRSWTYDDVKSEVDFTDGDGRTYLSRYSRDGMLSEVVLPSGHTKKMLAYDARGRILKLQDTQGAVFEYVRNAMGQIEEMWVDGVRNGRITSYGSHGEVESVEDSAAKTTYVYDDFGRLEKELHRDGAETGFDYYSDHRLRSITFAPGDVRTVAYDDVGYVAGIIDAKAGVSSNVAWKRDTQGRILEEQRDGRVVAEATYYADGILHTVNDYEFVRHPATALVSEVRDRGRALLRREYNIFGELRRAYTDYGFEETYAYDGAGRLDEVKNGVSSRTVTTRWANGEPQRVLQVVDGVQEEIAYAYDSDSRLVGVQSAQLGHLEYGYDAVGNLESVTDAATGIELERRGFDWSNVLRTVNRAEGETTLLYDDRGRLKESISATGDDVYEHDVRGRLRGIAHDGTTQNVFEYDAADRLIRDTHEPSARTRGMDYLGVLTIARIERGRVWPVVPDEAQLRPMAVATEAGYAVPTWWMGNAAQLNSLGGAVQQSYEWEPYGESVRGETSAMPFGYKGYYQSLEGDTHWAFTRSYSGALRSFTSPDVLPGDPFAPLTMNARRAFSADPVGVIDVLGLSDAPPVSVSTEYTPEGGILVGVALAAVAVWKWATNAETGDSQWYIDLQNTSEWLPAMAGLPALPVPTAGGSPGMPVPQPLGSTLYVGPGETLLAQGGPGGGGRRGSRYAPGVRTPTLESTLNAHRVLRLEQEIRKLDQNYRYQTLRREGSPYTRQDVQRLENILREMQAQRGGPGGGGAAEAGVAEVGAARTVNVLQSSGRTFVGTPGGRTVAIPEGWVWRVADSGKGVVFQQPGAAGNANMIRIMDPTAQYPAGYMRFYNSYGQPLDVLGAPGSRAATHIPLDYTGPINFPW